jgi:hypothetical protein
MCDHRTPELSEENARLDQAVLNLLFGAERQRPWSTTEIARMLSTPGHVPASIERLRTAGSSTAGASWRAPRTPPCASSSSRSSANATCAEEHHTENAVLESVLVRTEKHGRLVPELKIHRAFGAKKNKHKLAITDALISLEAAGLIERRSEHVIASEVARRLDQMML